MVAEAEPLACDRMRLKRGIGLPRGEVEAGLLGGVGGFEGLETTNLWVSLASSWSSFWSSNSLGCFNHASGGFDARTQNRGRKSRNLADRWAMGHHQWLGHCSKDMIEDLVWVLYRSDRVYGKALHDISR